MNPMSFLAEKPLEFFRDHETGRAVLVFFSTLHGQGQTVETPMGIILTTETARALLAALPALGTLLAEVTKVPTTLDIVQ
jgi:hypothetical protein